MKTSEAQRNTRSLDPSWLIRVLVADDEAMFLQALAAYLASVDDMNVVGVARNGIDAVEMAFDLRPDVAILDIYMPLLNGLDAARRIRNTCNVIIITGDISKGKISEAMHAGARAFLQKLDPLDDLARSIRRVAQKREVTVKIEPRAPGCPPSETRTRLLPRGDRRGGPVAPPRFTSEKSALNLLSTREREVLGLIAEGKCTKEIAAILGVSAKTVANHRFRVMEKLDIHDAVNLTRFSIANGLARV